jgi:hypothetical protein
VTVVGRGQVRSAGILCSGEKKWRKSPEVFFNDEKMVTPSPFVVTKGRFWWAFSDRWVLL